MPEITEFFEDNESILKINQELKIPESSFSFKAFTDEDVIKAIKNLPTNKASTKNDIPINIIKDLNQSCIKKLTDILNQCLIEGNFPSKLKRADITPIFKKGDCNDKENYHPFITNIFKSF